MYLILIIKVPFSNECLTVIKVIKKHPFSMNGERCLNYDSFAWRKVSLVPPPYFIKHHKSMVLQMSSESGSNPIHHQSAKSFVE